MARLPDNRPIPGYPQMRRDWRTPEIPPPPKLPTLGPGSWLSMAPKWAIGVLLIAPLFGGAAGIKSCIDAATAPKPATAEQGIAMIQRLEAVEKSNVRIEQKLDASIARGLRRDNALGGWACKMNGDRPTPIARGAPCNELVWDPPPLGSAVPWVAREEWPPE